VILINLLPHREERRKLRKTAFFIGLGVAAGVGLAIVGAWYLAVQGLIDNQRGRNDFLTAEIKKLEVQIKDIAMLKAEIESLKARQKAVEDLQVDRNLPVHLLNELVKQTPEGMYFSSVKQDAASLNVTGIAQTQERISEFLRNAANNAEWVTKPELIESKIATASAQNKDQRRLYDFGVRLAVKRPADAASAPAPGASAPAARPATAAKQG
jgi:type IV pilus assembly protein PilN